MLAFDSLEQLNRDLDERNLQGHWMRGADGLPRTYRSRSLPHVWRWEEIYPSLVRAGDLVGLDEAERRTLRLMNPGREGRQRSSTHTIHASFQYVKPGEHARAHRHTMTALRFVVSGAGAYTTVDGQQCRMHAGDLILTPSLAWHDHTNDGDDPIIWLDGHDGPLIQSLQQMQFDPYDRPAQSIRSSSAGMGDPFIEDGGPAPEGPFIHYCWERAYELLQTRAAAHRGFEPVRVHYGPRSGTLRSIDCHLLLLRPGQATANRRQTSTSLFHVVRGRGRTVVGESSLNWGEGDTFAIPLWEPHSFQNASDTDEVILFGMDDSPLLKALGVYREEPLQH